ncbi:uncharacterized protein [Sinocyclocheilus grahami]|uniref:uncharacterized protein n=1 Tax=Sinocyclocheilus grahami TaxID=75366 RepID=UPI0007ACB3E8|nr:PREDICTED: uncharacterized protein LOC107600971 [Sinocyclocheilus grahami]
MTDVKFSCPCIYEWNITITILIFATPAIVAFVIMILVLRPWTYKRECQRNKGAPQGGDNRRASQGGDNGGAPQGGDNGGAPQGGDNRRASQREGKKEASQSEIDELNVNLSCEKAVLACLVPSLVWICLCFIDGDYLACGTTYWKGHYACDKELHTNCLNWCKPNDLSQGKKDTEYDEYEKIRNVIALSKTTGYVLAIFFCIIAVIIVSYDCYKNGKSTCCGSTDPESQSHGRQGPGTENQPEQRNDNPKINNAENATEHDRLMRTGVITPPCE